MFTFLEPAVISSGGVEIAAVSGPTFTGKPFYPTLRVVDFQVVGELNKTPGYFEVRDQAGRGVLGVLRVYFVLVACFERAAWRCVAVDRTVSACTGVISYSKRSTAAKLAEECMRWWVSWLYQNVREAPKCPPVLLKWGCNQAVSVEPGRI